MSNPLNSKAAIKNKKKYTGHVDQAQRLTENDKLLESNKKGF